MSVQFSSYKVILLIDNPYQEKNIVVSVFLTGYLNFLPEPVDHSLVLTYL